MMKTIWKGKRREGRKRDEIRKEFERKFQGGSFQLVVTFWPYRTIKIDEIDKIKRNVPKLSTPALLETQVRSFAPSLATAAIKFSGMPHKPKPPTILSR